MNYIRLLPILLTLVLSTQLFAQHVSVQMPQQNGYVGVPLKLVVVFENVEPDKDPTIPNINGFSIRKLPNIQTSRHATIINGRITSTSSQAVTFLLTPEHTGTLTIPAITFYADGKGFQSQPLVLDITEPPTGGALRVEISGTDGDVYLGQRIDLTLNIFVEKFTDGELGVSLDARDMFSLLRNESDFGIFNESLIDGRAKVQEIIGINDAGAPTTFYVYSVQATAWPETTGPFELTPISILFNYPLSLEQTRGFGFFGGDQLRIDQSQLISAQSLMPIIEVLSPPYQEQAPWYSGGIGNFDFRLVAEPTYVDVGEPITLTMRVTDLTSGVVNLDYLAATKLDQVSALTKDFRVPDEILGGHTEGRTKLFTQSIRPKHEGIKVIPPIPFTSFNPKTNKYETQWTNTIPITVNATTTVSAEELFGVNTQHKNNSPNVSFTEIEGGILGNYEGDSLLINQTIESSPTLIASIAALPLLFLSLVCMMFYKKRHQTSSAKKARAIKHAVKTIQEQANASSIAQILRGLQHGYVFKDKYTITLDSIIQRCDTVQYGGEDDTKLNSDASKLLEMLQ